MIPYLICPREIVDEKTIKYNRYGVCFKHGSSKYVVTVEAFKSLKCTPPLLA